MGQVNPVKIDSNESRPRRPEILDRTVSYSLKIIKIYRELEKDSVGRILGNQLLRSGTSIGANLQEAQGGQTKADFISKISIAYKEALESLYWLRLIQAEKLISAEKVSSMMDETSQLVKILSTILLSSKRTS